MHLGFILPTALALALPAAARGDAVTATLAAAREAYVAGELQQAIESLEQAGRLVRQARAEQVAKLLPASPEGWTAAKVDQSVASSLRGGAISVQRDYHHRDGGTLTVRIQSDSPLLQSFAMAFNNPTLMAASNARLEQLHGQKFAVTYHAAQRIGDVKTVIANRYLVSIEAREVTRDQLLEFAGSINYAQLAALK
jgi:hypothetical protein